ncbi:hypothetical protein E2562_018449 [Oryza meyeriana var. granulata]|uniref:Uncharacterized protein n=1 Tax=Oryza meyeriana var. granulata TaxID=110450 RepID=A0A6G1EME6_9ORYZ|nr:hypothetical protein E2562_018449 [Oryza meyeriana var. granulata]
MVPPTAAIWLDPRRALLPSASRREETPPFASMKGGYCRHRSPPRSQGTVGRREVAAAVIVEKALSLSVADAGRPPSQSASTSGGRSHWEAIATARVDSWEDVVQERRSLMGSKEEKKSSIFEAKCKMVDTVHNFVQV